MINNNNNKPFTAAALSFLVLREGNTREVNYHYNEKLNTSWAKLGKDYHILSQQALRVLILVVTTYCCKINFWAFVCIKSKAKNYQKDTDAMCSDLCRPSH